VLELEVHDCDAFTTFVPEFDVLEDLGSSLVLSVALMTWPFGRPASAEPTAIAREEAKKINLQSTLQC
jgi:hypothetical protein